MNIKRLIDELNAAIPENRHGALKILMARIEAGDIPCPVVGNRGS